MQNTIKIIFFLVTVLLNQVHESNGKANQKCYMCNSAIKDCTDDRECPEALPHDKNCYQMEENPKAGEKTCENFKEEFDRQQKVLGKRAQKWKDQIHKGFPNYAKRGGNYPHIFENEVNLVKQHIPEVFCYTMTVYFPNNKLPGGDVIINEPFVLRGCMRGTRIKAYRHLSLYFIDSTSNNSCFYLNNEGKTMEICFCNDKDDCNDEDTGGSFSNTIFPSLTLTMIVGIFAMFRTKEAL